ncbi:hypothetical protein R1flu_013858 [Riccia fluitans]|uniref:Uncharacterized protein n=1 Tax=Riccia fluitans TaxID=41844 RepID=A0ABD1YHK8_9MARC
MPLNGRVGDWVFELGCEVAALEKVFKYLEVTAEKDVRHDQAIQEEPSERDREEVSGVFMRKGSGWKVKKTTDSLGECDWTLIAERLVRFQLLSGPRKLEREQWGIQEAMLLLPFVESPGVQFAQWHFEGLV